MNVPENSRATLESAASMRVLAHPTRLKLLGLLRELGPQTAAQLSESVDEAPGTLSYHLNKLASINLIEPAPDQGSDRRERWWRATATMTSWEPAELMDDPEQFAASTALLKSVSQGHAATYGEYLDKAPELERKWVAAAASSDYLLQLAAPELAQLRGELEALAERWLEVSAANAANGSGDQADIQSVVLMFQAYRRP